MTKERSIAGYRDTMSARPGDTINFMVSCFDGGTYEADLVRIISGNRRNKFATFELDEIAAPFAQEYEGRKQVTECGSYARVDIEQDRIAINSFSIACAVMPTTESRGSAALVTLFDSETGDQLCLMITKQRRLQLKVTGQGGAVTFIRNLSQQLPIKAWSAIGASYDSESRKVTLFQLPAGDRGAVPDARYRECIEYSQVALSQFSATTVFFAAAPYGKPTTQNHFTGRIDSIRILSKCRTQSELVALVQASNIDDDSAIEGFWDFSKDMGGARFDDLSANKRHGILKNLPTRAVRGIRWTGKEHSWRHCPDHYSAIHFSEYDIYDCAWEADFSYTVPTGLRSGFYAARLRKGEETEYVMFFVAPPIGQANAQIAVLASTATYLAYANDTNAALMAPLIGGEDAVLPEEELLINHPEFGKSLYHQHVDGFGIHFSSYLRPTVNIRPDSRAWSVCADTDTIHWLEKNGFEYDVITDEQLHSEGAELLQSYNVLITGTHPEYYSSNMRDGIEAFTHSGGRLMYMGGNGFYWKIAYSNAWPAAIELRRAEDGTRAWASQPGEYFQQFDGELGGLWRRQDLAPQKLVGVGFCAQGAPGGMRFRKTEDASDPRIAFAFDGVPEDVIADYGKMKASAMGEETDRADFGLGTPPHTLVLATSENAPANMLRAKEEILIMMPQIIDQDVKADITFFEVAGGGAVFSTGSIAWTSVLAYEDFQNPSARLTNNILLRFLDPTPFVLPLKTVKIEELIPQLYELPAGMGIDRLSYGRIIIESLRKAFLMVAFPILLRARNIRMPAPPPPRDSKVISNKKKLAEK